MDLSKNQKRRRDAVEAPLFRVEQLLDQLEEIRTRTDAAMRVWTETSRTLGPVTNKLDNVRSDLSKLQEELSQLWQEGFKAKWK